jgi:hypothetical protein
MLHAWRLALLHPLTGRPLRVESPPPADFARALSALRRASAPLRTGRGDRGPSRSAAKPSAAPAGRLRRGR